MERADLPSTVIVLDDQALSRLTERSSRQAWIEALAKGGLLDRMARATGDSEEGRILKEIRSTLVAWGSPKTLPSMREQWRGWLKNPLILAGISLVTLFTLVQLWQGHTGIFCFLFLGPLLYPLSRQPVLLPERDSEGPSEEASRLTTLVRRLLQRSFVTVLDGAVIEHIPHCALLRARLAEIDQAEAGLQARAAEIENTRREIARLNQRMGRPVEDAETDRLTHLLESEQRQRAGLEEMRAELEATLQRTEELLRELRMTAIRRALSDRTARLAAGSSAAGQALAAAETELSGYSARLEELAAETANADSRLRALLEVQSL